jgi:hypothetical protein
MIPRIGVSLTAPTDCPLEGKILLLISQPSTNDVNCLPSSLSYTQIVIKTVVIILLQGKNIHIIWNIIFRSYFYSDKYFIKRISLSSEESLMQWISPDPGDTTHSTCGVELKLKYSGRISMKTPTALVLTANTQQGHTRAYPDKVSMAT